MEKGWMAPPPRVDMNDLEQEAAATLVCLREGKLGSHILHFRCGKTCSGFGVVEILSWSLAERSQNGVGWSSESESSSYPDGALLGVNFYRARPGSSDPARERNGMWASWLW